MSIPIRVTGPAGFKPVPKAASVNSPICGAPGRFRSDCLRPDKPALSRLSYEGMKPGSGRPIRTAVAWDMNPCWEPTPFPRQSGTPGET